MQVLDELDPFRDDCETPAPPADPEEEPTD